MPARQTIGSLLRRAKQVRVILHHGGAQDWMAVPKALALRELKGWLSWPAEDHGGGYYTFEDPEGYGVGYFMHDTIYLG